MGPRTEGQAGVEPDLDALFTGRQVHTGRHDPQPAPETHGAEAVHPGALPVAVADFPPGQVAGSCGSGNALQAVVLAIKLESLEDWNVRRRAVAARYRERLEGRVAILTPEDPEARGCQLSLHVRDDARDCFAALQAACGSGTGSDLRAFTRKELG